MVQLSPNCNKHPTNLTSNIYLKLENLQPSGSFKSRGIGNLLSKAILSHGPNKPIHFYCSSGGNAGLACVTAAISLRRPATIVVPMSTSALMVGKLKTLGANVVQKGCHWSEADTYLREELLAHDKNGVYVPPFDHEDIWEGNGSLIDEVEKQMADKGGYDGIVCSVGGGGLFAGLMAGLERNGRLQSRQNGPHGVKVLAMETEGADSLAYSLRSQKLSRLDAITSIATSLGATQVARKAFEWAQRPEVTSCVFSDAEAAMASVNFADDERIIVETACGVSIAPAYNDTLHTILFPHLSDSEFEKINIVIVVCGGSNVTLDILEGYKQKYGLDERVVKKFHARKLRLEGQKSIPAAS
jgi:L-serine/L-threonine ammonia-lyase